MYERYYSTCQEMCKGLGTVRECRGGVGVGVRGEGGGGGGAVGERKGE